MLYSRKILFVFLIFFLVKPCAFSEGARPGKNILILYSFNPTRPGYQIITDGIRSQLTNAYGDAYNLHMEYMETERYPKNEYPEDRFELYNEKYRDVKLDLLICVGIDLVTAVRQHAGDHLKSLPTVTLDYDFSDIGYQIETSLNDKTAEIQFKVNAWKSISTALSIFPDTRSVCFICGISIPDRLMCDLTMKAAQNIDPDIKVDFLENITMDEVLKKVRHLPENSIIMIPNFNTDSKQVTYFNPEAVRLISQATSAPVFTFTDMGIGDGAIGGYILSFEKVGLLGGEVAVKILNGADPNSFYITEKDYYEYCFDWRALKQWNLIGSELIPKESIIKYEEISFLQKYRWIIIIASLFLLLQTLLIINLVYLNRKQKMVTRQLIDSDNRFRELVREDRILSLGQLTASLSHELNQPLTAILSTAQAGIRFLDSNNADPEMLKEIFQNIVEDDKRTASILSSIRGLMKLEQREKEKVNLNTLIEEMASIYKSEAVEKKIKLDINLTDQPVFIEADGIQIQQVLLNLFTNATQAIEKAGTRNRAIIISEFTDNDVVTVTVRDFGEGIDESMKDKIFKPFETSRKEGTGIGLAISHTIIVNHQGKIWAENIPGGGASFSFSLKICQDEQIIL
jgi:signal transduction histidine kinase